MKNRSVVPDSRKTDKYWVPVVSRTLDILECFASNSELLTLEQVVQRTGIPHTTAFRVLHTLVLRNYVSETGRMYQLKESRRKVRLGFANLSKKVAVAQDIEASLKEAASEKGYELAIWDNARDAHTALRNAEEMVAAKIDVAIEFQLFEEMAAIISELFAAANIPQISVVNPHHGTLYFGVDNFRAGYSAGAALAEYAARHWRRRPDLLVLLESPKAGRTVQSRMVGVLRAVEERFGQDAGLSVRHVDGGGGRETSERVVREILAASKKRRLLIAGINDECAIGAAEGVRKAGAVNSVAIVGHGGSEEMRALVADPSDPCIGTVLFHPERYGPALVDFAVAATKGRVTSPVQYIAHEFLGKADHRHDRRPDPHALLRS